MGKRFFLVLAIVAGLMVTGPGVAAATSGGSVHGRGAVILDGRPFTGDRVELRIHARNQDEGVRGRFHMLHQHPSGVVVAEIEGYVDCLVVTGNKAVVTGVITRGSDPFGGPAVGHEVSYTIVEGDQGTFAFGYDAFLGGIAPCQSKWLFNRPLTRGHFEVSGSGGD